MSLRLDAVQTHGGWRFAVLCEAVVRARHLGGGIFGTGTKRPVAVVFHDGETLTAMDFRGRALDVETLERNCPGLSAAFAEDQGSGDQSIKGPAGTMPKGFRSSDGEK
ncbi:hypothetical protein [Silicimonas sp. MF1-12-2]|uniref:hypothetical protein n=1 Tax=Silicimonas sp. MF1-12-2 TaxID=3384793 RepID=UPI0039B50454